MNEQREARMDPDLLILNAVFLDSAPGGDALAIENGRIAALGPSREIARLGGDRTRVLDAERKLVVPGFIDAHTHWGLNAESIARAADCRTPPVDSIADIIRIGRERASTTPPSEWIFLQGSSFQDDRVREHRFPTSEELNEVSRSHPVMYKSQLHHIVVNSIALRMAGITRETLDPPGGRIDRHPDTGEPTGVLLDMYSRLPLPTADPWLLETALTRVAREHYLSQGVTTIHEIVDSLATAEIQQALIASGEVPLRVRAYPWVPVALSLEDAIKGDLGAARTVDDWFEFGGIKLFADGGTSSCTAAFYDEYLTRPGYRGSLVYEDDVLERTISAAHQRGIQVLVHACGDRAQDQVLHAFSQCGSQKENQVRRHRVEHIGNVAWTKERAAACRGTGVLPIPNIGFIFNFGEFWPKVLGTKRAAGCVPLRSMLQEGFPLPGTSDTSGADFVLLHPLHNISRAVERKTYSGSRKDIGEAISVRDGIRMYTANSAFVGRTEESRGSLEVGKLADLVVVDGWPDSSRDAHVESLEVAHTIVGGQIVYSQKRISPGT